MAKKQSKFKLKTKVIKKEPLNIAVVGLLQQFVEDDFDSIKVELEEKLQLLFKGYPEYTYFGYSTQLGMLHDLVIHYELKK